jgi:hypothetical protein
MRFQRRKPISHPVVAGIIFAVGLGCLAAPSLGQSTIAPLTVAEPVANQMIAAWAKALVDNDLESLTLYYAHPMAVTPWREYLATTRILQANLLAVHYVKSASDQSWGGTPLCGEVRFTIEFWLNGLDKPFNETRSWGLTNRNGYLQVAYERREKEAALPPRRVEQAQFPQLGNDPASSVSLVEPLPQPTPYTEWNRPDPTPFPVATPTLNEGPIEKKELIDQIWNTLLLRFRKAYEYRSEDLFKKCFVKDPTGALEEFRGNIEGRGWLQVDRLEIDADSVKGNNLNCTFRFRYSLWGAGLKRDDLIEVDCAATRGGPGWRFARYGDELIAPPARAPGYYPTEDYLKPLVLPPPSSPWQRFLGGGS